MRYAVRAQLQNDINTCESLSCLHGCAIIGSSISSAVKA